jgi:hypothetical protein
MRLSPPSLGSSVKIEEGTLAFGNDKNLWLRKRRNDKNTYWSSFAELNLQLGIPRNEEGTYNYLQIQWEIPDFGIFNLTYINSGRITFQCIANNNEQLLYANVPLQRFDKLKNQIRLEALRGIVYDFSKNIVTDNDTIEKSILKMMQELDRFWRVILNNLSELQLRYSLKNDYDFQAEVDFPLNKTFRPARTNLKDLEILKFEEDQESEQEPTPTPQSETPEAEKGLPSTDPNTWNGEFKVGDKVKVRWDYSNDLGLEKTKGFSKVDYFSSENNFSIVEEGANTEFMRPQNPSGKLYKTNNGKYWEGKDLELFTEQEQPTPTPQSDEFKPIWRVKTEQEFIDEFGENWATTIIWNVRDMDYLLGKPVTNPMFDLNFSVDSAETLDTAKDLGIDSGRQNTWFLRRDMFTKIDYDEQESSPMIGKLFLKQYYDTYLQISENEDRLVLNSDEFQYIKPFRYDSSVFTFNSTYNAKTFGIALRINLDYEKGISILYKNEKTNYEFFKENITSESVFYNAIGDVRKFFVNPQFEKELDAIALLLQQGIWRERSIVCDFMSSIPYPKFQVGDKVTKINNKKRIFTITSITTFDDNEQQWDYDVVEDTNGNKLSYWENQLELVSTEIPTTNECDVDVSLIDSQYVGQFYQQNKNRIEALNPNISCLFLEALLSLSNYEKCGDGVEIPMPQPKKEVKEDLLSQIRNL